MSDGLDTQYFRLALHTAKQRDLSAAAKYAHRSLLINPENEKASRLLGLCLHEMGEPGRITKPLASHVEQSDPGHAGTSPHGMPNETLVRLKELARKKKWRKADSILRGVEHQSVRILTMRGCIKAAAGKYMAAAGLFARALEKDKGNHIAAAYLQEVAGRRNRLRLGVRS